MIKTVSFAPPRAVRAAASSNKTLGKNANSRAASSSAPAKPSPVKTQVATSSANSAKAEIAPATLNVVEARAALTPKKPRAAKVAPDAPAETVVAEVKPAKRSASKMQTAEKIEEITDETVVATEKAAPKAKRSRVPKDLAAQYGGAAETESVPRRVVETVAPRKRLTRAKKEARSQLLRADDEVLQRLQQANAIAAKKPERRGRGWEFECGCCGRITRFQTPGAICECGAIAVRE